MVNEALAESGERVGAVTRVARQLGIGPESLRSWVKQAEIDDGKRPGMTTAEQRRIAELERENRELRRANEILKAASAFFARYADIGITRQPVEKRLEGLRPSEGTFRQVRSFVRGRYR